MGYQQVLKALLLLCFVAISLIEQCCGRNPLQSSYMGDGDVDSLDGEVDQFVDQRETRGNGGIKAYSFPCDGITFTAKCFHGGKGPRKVYGKSGRRCVCLCPADWIGPQCGYPSDQYNAFQKRGPSMWMLRPRD